MSRITHIIVMAILPIWASSQTSKLFIPDSNQAPNYDTNYIKTFRDNFVVTLVSAANSNLIGIQDSLGNDIEYAANLPTSFGIGLDYKWFTAEYTSSFGNLGDPKKGYTKSSTVGFGLTMRKFWFRNFLQKMRGYHMVNPSYINPEFNPAIDNYPYRSDISTTVYYASINYGFNHKRYSHMASMWQLERQRKSAGSFTMGLSYAYNAFGADSALAPKKLRDQFISKEFITGYYRNTIGVNVGYLYTLAMGKDGKFFISLALIPGLSFQHEKAYFADNKGKAKLDGLGAHGEFRGSLGFNGDRWYTSASLAAYVIASSFEGRNPSSDGYGFGRFVIGYKFDAPKIKWPFLKKIGL